MNVRRGFLLLLVTLLAVLSVAMVLPFLQYFLVAGLLAFVLTPLQHHLEPRIGESGSSIVLIIGTLVALIIPFIVVIASVAGDAARLAQNANVEAIGVDRIEGLIQQYTGQQVDLVDRAQDAARTGGEALAGSAGEIFGAVTHVLVGIGLTLFVLFFLLKDGDKLYAWIREITPLPDDVQDDLYTSLEDITWAVLLGHVLVAVVQGAIAGVGLFVTGIPNAFFWTFVMMVLSLLPVIGSFLVWGPAAIYLVVNGQTVAGAALFIYGAIVVGATDDFLRPVVVDRYAELNPSIIIVGVIGGLYLIGFMGLFIGPVIVGALKVVLEEFDEYYEEL
jgi:predicted PurR-regulated permease PerM